MASIPSRLYLLLSIFLCPTSLLRLLTFLCRRIAPWLLARFLGIGCHWRQKKRKMIRNTAVAQHTGWLERTCFVTFLPEDRVVFASSLSSSGVFFLCRFFTFSSLVASASEANWEVIWETFLGFLFFIGSDVLSSFFFLLRTVLVDGDWGCCAFLLFFFGGAASADSPCGSEIWTWCR